MQKPDFLPRYKKLLLELAQQELDLDSDYRTFFAHHEAGHAVAAVLLGERISKININPDAQLNGDIVFGVVETVLPEKFGDGKLEYVDLTQEDKDILERNIMVSMAGEIYVRKLFDERGVEGFEEDISHVEEVIAWMFESPEDISNYRELLSARLNEMFEKRENLHAAAVLADALLRDGEISGEEATRVIREAIANPPDINAPNEDS